jgi:aspartyl-tRNA synthetase
MTRRSAPTAPTSLICATRSRCRMSPSIFAGSGFKVFAGMIANDPKVEVWAIPAKTGGSRAFCDRMNSWAQGEGQPGPRLHLLAQGRRRTRWRRPDCQEHRSGAHRSHPPADGPGRWRRLLLRRRRSGKFAKFAGDARAQAGEELNLVDEDRFELCWIVDFPFYEWDEEPRRSTSRTTRSRCRRAAWKRLRTRPADHQGLPV